MRSQEFVIKLMTVVKRQAKAKGYSQPILAKKLNVSLPTLKRWLAGKTVRLDNLKQLSDVLGLSFVELAAATDEGSSRRHYTLEQEAEFAKKPEFLAFFDFLLRGQRTLKTPAS